jgi:hypothetical protein
MATTDLPMNRLRQQLARFTRVLVCAVVVVGTQTHLQSVRWWWSPPIVSALALTQQQSAALEKLYRESLPTRQHASEDVVGLTDDIATRLQDELYDDELLHLTAKLAGARLKQYDLQRAGIESAVHVLTPSQRDELTRLIVEKRITD